MPIPLIHSTRTTGPLLSCWPCLTRPHHCPFSPPTYRYRLHLVLEGELRRWLPNRLLSGLAWLAWEGAWLWPERVGRGFDGDVKGLGGGRGMVRGTSSLGVVVVVVLRLLMSWISGNGGGSLFMLRLCGVRWFQE